MWFLFKRRIKYAIRVDEEECRKQLELEQTLNDLQESITQLNYDLEHKRADLNCLTQKVARREAEYEKLSNHLEKMQASSKAAADAVYETNMTVMENALEQSAEKLGEQYRKGAEQYQNEYLTTLQELTDDFISQLKEKKEKIFIAQSLLDDLQSRVSAAVAADKRALEIQEQANFYRLNLSKEELEEISRLKDVLPYLKDEEPLNKVIWKVYYEKPYTDLTGRVIGSEVKTGIYKITNLNNHMCYVGQAVDLAARWKQHIKRGLGAETPTRNKLYPAMKEFGVENFSFEIIEECDRALLDEREDFWQNYFKAKEFGYSIK